MTSTLCRCGAAGFHTCTTGERYRGPGWECPDCGYRNMPEERFCYGCGAGDNHILVVLEDEEA